MQTCTVTLHELLGFCSCFALVYAPAWGGEETQTLCYCLRCGHAALPYMCVALAALPQHSHGLWSSELFRMHRHQPRWEGWLRRCSHAEPCSTSTASSPAPLARVCQNFGPCDVLLCFPEGTEVSPVRRVPSLPHRSLPLQICGGFRVETCTPARCEGLLCPRDNSTACGAGRPCRGIFPLSSGALAMAGEAAREFRSLSTRLRETAQLVSAGSTACPVAKPHARSFGVIAAEPGGTAVERASCDKIPNLKLRLRLDLLDSCRNSGIFEWEASCCVRGSYLPPAQEPQSRRHVTGSGNVTGKPVLLLVWD